MSTSGQVIATRRVGRGFFTCMGTRLAAAASVEDLVQDFFTRAFGPIARQAYDGRRDYGAYLHTIVQALTSE